MPGSFLDTNVLIYLAANDPAKAERAEALLAGESTISVQVLNEIASVGRRKMGLSWSELIEFLATVRALTIIEPMTLETHLLGFQLCEKYGFSIYDGMIVAAALRAGCDTLWSEDMQDRLLVEGALRICNPFAVPEG